MARGCEEDISLAESRIKASSKFFGPSCKAGPWVADPVEDKVLSESFSDQLHTDYKFLIFTSSFLQNPNIPPCARSATTHSSVASATSTGDDGDR